MTSGSILLLCPSCRTQNRLPLGRIGNRPLCGRCRTALHAPSAPVNATAGSFDHEMGSWLEFLLVEFWSRTCGYCRMVEPVVNDIARWRTGRLKVLKVDVGSELSLARRFEAMATPTFIMFRNGQTLGRIDGAPREKLDLVQWVDRFLG